MVFQVIFVRFAQSTARLAQVAVVIASGCMAEGSDLEALAAAPDEGVVDAPSPMPSDPSKPAAGDGVPCAVSTVLDRKCNGCHAASPKYGAPMSLVTYGDLLAATPSKPGKKVYEEVVGRIHDDARPMPQTPNPRLTAGELATLDGWTKSGAPRGQTCGADTPASEPAETPLGCTPDVKALPAAPYAMPASERDVYTCYGFEQTVTTKRHATAFRIKVDNAKLVHHVLLFQSDKAVSSTPQPCAATSLASWRMVYGWSPGSKGRELPAEAGIPVEGTTHWVVQVHYNKAKALAGEKDSTGFEMCTTDKLRKYDADMLVWGTRDISIPAKSRHDLSCTFKPSSLYLPAIHIVSGSPHMHGLGKTFTTTLKKRDGRSIDLGSTTAFDWGNQQSYAVAPDTIVDPDDTVTTRCVWDNPSSSPVKWGEGTEDEMCFNFTMYYPKIKSPLWSWIAPALISSCSVTK